MGGVPRHPFVENLRRHLVDSRITIDAMLDRAREIDPDGYSRETLRAMEGGSRRIQLRAMWAMAIAVGYPADEDPYYRLALVRYLLDDGHHDPQQALANFEELGITVRIKVSPEEIKTIPISHRRDAIHVATRLSS